jgi:hypothetical protein
MATRGALALVIAVGEAVVEVIDEATGSVLVRVPRVITEGIAPGRYIDALRSILDDAYKTEVIGQLDVQNPGFVIQPGDSPS